MLQFFEDRCFWGIWGWIFQIHAPLCLRGCMCIAIYSMACALRYILWDSVTYRQAVCLRYLRYLQLFLKRLKTANYFSANSVGFRFHVCLFIYLFLYLFLQWASSGIVGGFQNVILAMIFILLVTIVITNPNLEGMSLFSILVWFLYVCFGLGFFF